MSLVPSIVFPQNPFVKAFSNNPPNVIRFEGITNQISNATLYAINVFISGDFSLAKGVFEYDFSNSPEEEKECS